MAIPLDISKGLADNLFSPIADPAATGGTGQVNPLQTMPEFEVPMIRFFASIVSSVYRWLAGKSPAKGVDLPAVPPAGLPSAGGVFYPPLPEPTGETSLHRLLIQAWEAHGDCEKRNVIWATINDLIGAKLATMADNGLFERQSRSGAPHKARGEASGVTAKANMGAWIAAHGRRGGVDQQSQHAGQAIMGTVFLAFERSKQAGEPCPYWLADPEASLEFLRKKAKALGDAGKKLRRILGQIAGIERASAKPVASRDGSAMGYFIRTGGNEWSEQVLMECRSAKRDDNGAIIDPEAAKAHMINDNDAVSREADPAVAAEEWEPELIARVQREITAVFDRFPSEVKMLWAAGVCRVDNLTPWEGKRSRSSTFILRSKLLAQLGAALELYRGPAVAYELDKLASHWLKLALAEDRFKAVK